MLRTGKALSFLLLCGSAFAFFSHTSEFHTSTPGCITGDGTVSSVDDWLHTIDCPTERYALSGFHYTDIASLCFPNYRVRAVCTTLESRQLTPLGPRCYKARTECSPGTERSLEDFYEHPIQCGVQEALRTWSLRACLKDNGQPPTEIYFEYECCLLSAEFRQLTQHATTCVQTRQVENLYDLSWDGLGQARFHDVRCPSGSYLQSFFYTGAPSCPLTGNIVRDNYAASTQVRYQCIGRPAPTVEVGWNSANAGECVEIPKFITAYMLAFWKIDCPTSLHSLTGFHYNMHDCPSLRPSPERKFLTKCSVAYQQPHRCAILQTPCSAGYDSFPPEYWPRHHLACGYGESMKWFKLVFCAPANGVNNWAFQYECCTHEGHPRMVTRPEPFQSACAPAQDMEMLREMPIECPPGGLLNGWRMRVSPQGPCQAGYANIEFTCLEEDTMYGWPIVQRVSDCRDARKSLSDWVGNTFVECPDTHAALNGFVFTQDDCPRWWARFETSCTRGISPWLSCRTASTVCRWGAAGGLPSELEGTPVVCAPREAITNWKLTKCETGFEEFRIDYSCCVMNARATRSTTHITACRQNYHASVHDFLDAPVRCPDTDFLQSWRYVQCQASPKAYQMIYECFSPELSVT
ncbi:hypothetical protein DIPPA_14652 [Diplonema papillatum]|nr:hypothetical protein DIPPA_14652 [Diplonema papillatum]